MPQLRTGYSILKDMFDSMYSGKAYPMDYDNITNIYRDAFGVRISQLPKYIFTLNVFNNPINRIIVFGNDSDLDLLTGAIPSQSGLDYMTAIDKRFEYGLNSANIESYIDYVYRTISGVIGKDRMNACGPKEPYGIFIRACPFYLTFHHIYNVAFDLLNTIDEDIFNKYLAEFVADEDDFDTVMQSISGDEYNPTFEEICSIMTCKNTIEFK